MSMFDASDITTVVQPSVRRFQQPRERYIQKFGITEVAFAVFFMISSGISLLLNSSYISIFVSAGIWCGVFPFLSGAFGICLRFNPTYCAYVTNIVMSIFTAMAMSVLISLSVIGGIYSIGIGFILQITSAVGGFIVFIIAIVHAAYCCAGLCGPTSHPNGLVYVQKVSGQQNLVQLSNGQFAQIINYPIAEDQSSPTSYGNVASLGNMASISNHQRFKPESASDNPPAYTAFKDVADNYAYEQ